jgi:Ras-related protein Rab-2A
MHDYLLKLIIIGDSGVGKSNILSRFTDNRFMKNYDTTIGVEFGIKLMALDGLKYKLHIWDTAGQETFKSITRSYYRGTVGCLLVYDITRRESFESVKTWLVDLRNYCHLNIVITLIGNKIDMNDERQVTLDEGQEFATKNGLLFFETSAKIDHNINDVFVNVVTEITKKLKTFGLNQTNKLNEIKLTNAKQEGYGCRCQI